MIQHIGIDKGRQEVARHHVTASLLAVLLSLWLEKRQLARLE